MNRRVIKTILGLLSVVIIATAVNMYLDYRHSKTPTYAIEQILIAIENKDEKLFYEYVDMESLLTTSYSETIYLLADNVQELSKQYPNDYFFRNDADKLRHYMYSRQDDDITLIKEMLSFYFDDKLVPVGKQAGNAKWFSDELIKFEDTHEITLVSIANQNDNRAIVTIRVIGDNTIYGKLLPELVVEFVLQQSDGGYKLIEVNNSEAIFYPIVAGVENYWDLQGWQ